MVATEEMVFEQERWSLGELFPGIGSAELEQALQEHEQGLQAFEARRPELAAGLDPAAFVAILGQYDELVRLVQRLLGYAYLRFAEDTQDQQAQTNLARFRQLAAEAQNRTLFFELWWKEIDDEAAGRLLAAAGDFRYWLESLRRQRPYTLSEAEEKVINLKNVNGPQALAILYESITNRYAFKLEIDGAIRELNREELAAFYRHTDADLRAAAFQELLRVYAADAPVLGQIYQSLVHDWRSEHVNLRGFASPLSVRNLNNDVPDEVVDTLLEVCRANAPLFHRYFRLKARALGLERLRRYDIYAPLAKTEKEYPFAQGARLVLDSLGDFDPRLAQLARRVFADHHLDSQVRKGKVSGAFCASIAPGVTPWVLQTYQGRPYDVATLAHELGHAIHDMLADHHTTLTHQASLPLAETASTFSEMLLTDRLMAEDPDPAVQRDLLFTQMDGAYMTIMRQAYFALFEGEAHELIKNGASVEELSQRYLANVQEQFGDSLDLSDEFAHEWVAVPHIYVSPFYVYAYAFGQLLVLSLYQQYLQEGEGFKPRYLAILAAGGSDSPGRVLVRAGIDIHAREFWQGGFDVIRHQLDRLEQLV